MTTLTLAEAIRLGAMMTEPMFGHCFNASRTRTCALGAVFIAAGIENYFVLSNLFPVLDRVQEAACPQCGAIPRTPIIRGTIIHLNDDHRWTRQRIADWVETIERAQPRAGTVDLSPVSFPTAASSAP